MSECVDYSRKLLRHGIGNKYFLARTLECKCKYKYQYPKIVPKYGLTTSTSTQYKTGVNCMFQDVFPCRLLLRPIFSSCFSD